MHATINLCMGAELSLSTVQPTISETNVITQSNPSSTTSSVASSAIASTSSTVSSTASSTKLPTASTTTLSIATRSSTEQSIRSSTTSSIDNPALGAEINSNTNGFELVFQTNSSHTGNAAMNQGEYNFFI